MGPTEYTEDTEKRTRDKRGVAWGVEGGSETLYR
jgi:hypothetical protein